MKNRLAGCAVAAAALLAASACGSSKNEQAVAPAATVASGAVASSPVAALPHVIIYKTKRDYSRNVPVTMDADRERIVSYPAPSDLRRGGALALPTPLDNGYWLDNRGIGRNVAFLSLTYEEYSALEKTPTIEELKTAIIDTDPLEAIIDCGPRSKFEGDLVEAMNEYIRANNLR